MTTIDWQEELPYLDCEHLEALDDLRAQRIIPTYGAYTEGDHYILWYPSQEDHYM